MFKKLAYAFCVSLLAASTGWAQCQCSSCQDGSGAYNQVVGQDGSCGAYDDWHEDFYDCCRHNIFDVDICDPCCNRPYLSFFGGATNLDAMFRDIDLSATMTEEQGVEFADGYGFGGAIGYRVHHHVRVEAEYSFRSNNAETWFTREFTNDVLTSEIQLPAVGTIESHAGMFNIVYDFSQRRIRCFNLYAGGGLGVVTIDSNITAGGVNYTSDDSRFAFQFIGGVNYPLAERVEVFMDYRYLGADSFDTFDATNGLFFGDVDFNSHNLFMGLRFNL